MTSQLPGSDVGTPIKGSIQDISIEDEKALDSRITRKIDLRVVPMLCMLYLTAYLDRTNIGNAKLLGLEKELKMPANGYNTAVWTFFLTFVLMEVPSNLLMTHSKIPPNWWLGMSLNRRRDSHCPSSNLQLGMPFASKILDGTVPRASSTA